MSAERDRSMLSEQREVIVAKIEDAALAVLTDQGDGGAALVAAVLRQAADIARWTAYDPPAQKRVLCPSCGRSVAVSPNGYVFSHLDTTNGGRCAGSRAAA